MKCKECGAEMVVVTPLGGHQVYKCPIDDTLYFDFGENSRWMTAAELQVLYDYIMKVDLNTETPDDQ